MNHVMASEIADLLNGRLLGKDKPLYGVSLLKDADCNKLVVLYDWQINTDPCSFEFGAIILPPRFMLPTEKTVIITTEPIQQKWHLVMQLFLDKGVYQYRELHTATNSVPLHIGGNSFIGTGAVFGNNVTIGNGCTIGSNSVIGDDVVIGDNVIIESGAVIGNESYQFCRDNDRLYKVPNIGTVIIGDNVEIGANTTIDRGTIGNTIIGNGTKIGNLVQIGHETIIGENCMIVSQTGISGWVTIGDRVTVYGQVGINNSVSICDDTVVLAKSGVSKNIHKSETIWGIPAIPSNEYMKQQAYLRKLYRRRKK